MQGFSSSKIVSVVLSRPGGEEVALSLHAPPPGWVSWLRSAWPTPVITRPGKAPEPDPAEAGAHAERFLLVLVGKCLEGGEDNLLATRVHADSPGAWRGVADALLAEFRNAHLTDGEINTLAATALREFVKEVTPQGN